jgi:CO/xanthine dehydrogenase FAD-binding subunit
LKPARFRYFAPTTIEEVVSLLAEYGDESKLLAGGQSLVPLMNIRLSQPAVLIDLNRVTALDYVTKEDDRLEIGALTRHRAVAESKLVQERFPAAAQAAGHIGYPAIRNRGTIGGTLAHADPVAEMPCIAVLNDCEIVATSSSGSRTIRASDFFHGYFTTSLEPTEFVSSVRFTSRPASHGWGFSEFARKSGDFALSAAAVDVIFDGGAVTQVSIAIAGASDRPVRAPLTEAALVGTTLSRSEIEQAVSNLSSELDPPSDAHASSDFRTHLAQIMTERALLAAAQSER